MAKRPDAEQRIIDAALKLAAESPWRSVALDDIAAKAKVSPDRLRERFRSKAAILAAFHRRLDDAMLKGADKAKEDGVRDQLFEMLMRRFDALQPHRAALRSILQGTVIDDPPATLMGARALVKSMAKALDAAGVGGHGPLGLLRAKALTAVYLGAARVWMTDESEDLGPTMAALDRGLRAAGRLAEMCAGVRGRGRDD